MVRLSSRLQRIRLLLRWSRRRLLLPALAAALAAVLALSVVPDARAMFFGLSCRDWSSRPVEAEFFSPEAVADLALRSGPSRSALLVGYTDALALPGRVLFGDETSWALYVHEVVHQHQMEEMGAGRFFLAYGSQWLQGRYAGCGPFDAYRAISLERSARHAEMMLPRSWRHRPFDGEVERLVEVLRQVEERGSCPRLVCGDSTGR